MKKCAGLGDGVTGTAAADVRHRYRTAISQLSGGDAGKGGTACRKNRGSACSQIGRAHPIAAGTLTEEVELATRHAVAANLAVMIRTG